MEDCVQITFKTRMSFNGCFQNYSLNKCVHFLCNKYMWQNRRNIYEYSQICCCFSVLQCINQCICFNLAFLMSVISQNKTVISAKQSSAIFSMSNIIPLPQSAKTSVFICVWCICAFSGMYVNCEKKLVCKVAFYTDMLTDFALH